MLTGALAASYYGTPRTTMDIDIVVKVPQDELRAKLVSALRRAGLQVDEERMKAAAETGFRIVTFKDVKSPFSVDIIFFVKEFEKKAGAILSLPTFYQTPEALVLAKLRMIKVTVPRERALKDEDDVRAILEFTKVDKSALLRQARKEGTISILETIVAGENH